MKVYLAGGFHSDWRNNFVNSKHEVIDPAQKEKTGEWNMQMIGAWDKHAIRSSDILFVYMEATNISGYGLAGEIGFAHGLGKTTILVLERNHEKYKYLNFLTTFADVVFDNLQDGINFLESL